MRKCCLLLWLTAAALQVGCNACNNAPPDAYSLPVTLRPQETWAWCWAASGEMVLDFLGTNVTQCDQANKNFNSTDCCNQPTPKGCRYTSWPEFEKYGYLPTMKDVPGASALTWDEIRAHVYTRRQPWVFSWTYPDYKHLMVGIGYATGDGVNWVEVNDPGPINQGSFWTYTYDEYAGVAQQDYTYGRTYRDFEKKP